MSNLNPTHLAQAGEYLMREAIIGAMKSDATNNRWSATDFPDLLGTPDADYRDEMFRHFLDQLLKEERIVRMGWSGRKAYGLP